MSSERIVHCVKLQRDLPGLEEIPFEGHPLGQRIYDNVSKEAWKGWVEHMKMLMNEYRLNLGTKEAQEFILQQMDSYFFGTGGNASTGLRAPEALTPFTSPQPGDTETTRRSVGRCRRDKS